MERLMARNTVTPVSMIDHRAPEAGRIRLGVKTGRAMKAIDTFRFTSPYEEQIRKLAELYGGEARPWSDDRARIKNQWEVISPAKEISVYVPPNGLNQQYEAWTGGGRTRACDGETCEIIEMHGDSVEIVETPCICIAKGVAECKLYTRMNLVLPELPFRGTWRLETKGWNAGAELPGMFNMIRMLHDQGNLVQAKLTLEARTDKQGGKTRNFVVPVLTVSESPLEIQAGTASVGAIGSGPRAALSAAPLPLDAVEAEVHEVEVHEVELIEDGQLELEDLLRSDAIEFDMDPDRFLVAVRKQAEGNLARMMKCHETMALGQYEPLGFKANGAINWKKLT